MLMCQILKVLADAEKKVDRILIIKRRNRGKKKPELIALVEDFHKQYHSVHAHCDHLKRESDKRGHDGKVNESYSFHATSLDSEYYSSDDIQINSRSPHIRMAGNMEEELKRAYIEIADLKHQLASKTEEKEVLASDHLAALSNIQEIETINRDEAPKVQISVEGEEITKLMKQIKDNEGSLTSKIEDSMAQVCNLKKEVDFLLAQQCESGGKIACKTNESFDEENIMKQELDSLCSQKAESETLIERKSKEISQYLIQVKTLKEELARKIAAEQIMVEEKKCLQVQMMDLESELDALRKQKNKSEDEVRSNIHEIDQLREEKGHLNARILELEALFRERDLELKETAQIMTLNAEVEVLQQKLDSMKIEKNKLELQIADQQRISKEREESINRSMESNSKLTKRLSLGTNFNYNTLERKMEDLAQEFRKKAEDNIRLLYQRITVAEKIHYENKENYKKLEQENGALEQKLATCEAELRKLRDSMEPDKNASTGLNPVLVNNNKLEDDGNSLSGISNVAAELVSANDCDTGRENGIEQLKSDVNLVVAEMDKENEELKEKVMNLEAKLGEEGEEKLNLLKTVSELENRVGELEKMKREMEETLLGREEEKREAIRQLCLLIDYHRSRCDHLKELISKSTVRCKKNT
ncbi:hypothetical protein PTKIN_Ptkin04bG0178800 [Pterospermum kingtungense]